MKNRLKINNERLCQRLDELAKIGALESGGITRWALSGADKQARNLAVSWMKELGMEVHVDKVGNIIGIRSGTETLTPVMLGSHLDTVTEAGRYDGSYGVMAALECIQTLNDNDIQTRRSVAVTAFTNEEGVRYAPGMLGSAAYTGKLSVEQARAVTGFDGSNFGAELDRIGYAGSIDCGAIQPFAFLELHIEQGPILDEAKIPIGIVESVVGITWLEITINGSANHAGTTPTELRRDAGLAAAKTVVFLREIAMSLGGNQRATCGRMAFEPNAINVIPGKAIFTVDMRNSDGEALKQAETMLYDFAKDVEKSDRVTISIRPLEHVLPVAFNPDIVNTIEQITSELAIPSQRMISGAGHDAQLMANVCPTAMIFVPSKHGISHNPAEYSSPEELEAGANVLLYTMLELAEQG